LSEDLSGAAAGRENFKSFSLTPSQQTWREGRGGAIVDDDAVELSRLSGGPAEDAARPEGDADRREVSDPDERVEKKSRVFSGAGKKP